MILITDDASLRKFLPNVLQTVKGEASLFDKISPFLDTAELWVADALLSGDTLTAITALPDGHKLKALTAQIVVSEAFRQAVPSLDLVLTPNGFGIVSNSNVAPASKERVERLIAQLLQTRDHCIEVLLPQLPTAPQWLGSSRAQFYGGTMFPTMDLPTLVGGNDRSFRKYLELRQRIEMIEQSLAFSHISEELYKALRLEQLLQNFPSGIRQHAAVRLRNIELQLLDNLGADATAIDSRFAAELLTDLIQHIRTHPEDFPEWHSSTMPEIFNPPVFENKKEAKGYWF